MSFQHPHPGQPAPGYAPPGGYAPPVAAPPAAAPQYHPPPAAPPPQWGPQPGAAAPGYAPPGGYAPPAAAPGGYPAGVPGGAPPGYGPPPAAPPRKSKYAGADLPGARKPELQLGTSYLEITKTELIGGSGKAETFVVEFVCRWSDNPAMNVGGEYGYPISMMYESGLGCVAQLVLAAFGCQDETQFYHAYAQQGLDFDSICVACESNPDTLKGRMVASNVYLHTAGEKSKTPGKQRNRATIMPMPAQP